MNIKSQSDLTTFQNCVTIRDMTATKLETTLASFTATIHRTKNRLVAIPADMQRLAGLERRRDNHILRVSWRAAGSGRWNHHYVKLTGDNEFAIPSDVTGLRAGDQVDVKIHAVIPDRPLPPATAPRTAAGALLDLASRSRPGWREDGATRLDEYLERDIRDGGA